MHSIFSTVKLVSIRVKGNGKPNIPTVHTKCCTYMVSKNVNIAQSHRKDMPPLLCLTKFICNTVREQDVLTIRLWPALCWTQLRGTQKMLKPNTSECLQLNQGYVSYCCYKWIYMVLFITLFRITAYYTHHLPLFQRPFWLCRACL